MANYSKKTRFILLAACILMPRPLTNIAELTLVMTNAMLYTFERRKVGVTRRNVAKFLHNVEKHISLPYHQFQSYEIRIPILQSVLERQCDE